ncbi:uncharacterized protein LOC142026551 [Buteo buteo]|uniref:uncharacterized protein LOC142026551 n=1 Tax=Buteo buteo TaxID=30397 RepID=UPI003EBC3D88
MLRPRRRREGLEVAAYRQEMVQPGWALASGGECEKARRMLLLLLSLLPLPLLLQILLLLLLPHDNCFPHLSRYQPQMLKVRVLPFALGYWFT